MSVAEINLPRCSPLFFRPRVGESQLVRPDRVSPGAHVRMGEARRRVGDREAELLMALPSALQHGARKRGSFVGVIRKGFIRDVVVRL